MNTNQTQQMHADFRQNYTVSQKSGPPTDGDNFDKT